MKRGIWHAKIQLQDNAALDCLRSGEALAGMPRSDASSACMHNVGKTFDEQVTTEELPG